MSPHAKSSLFLAIVAWLLCVWGILFPAALSAQVIKVEAGASDILPSQGGSIQIQGENYQGYVGAGDIDGVFRFGSYLNTSWERYKFALGDQTSVIGLPTDIFGARQYFVARGGSVSGQVSGKKFFLFGGEAALAIGSQFFQAATAQVPVGMFFFDIPLSDKLTFYSRNVFSHQQTSIEALDWRPHKWLDTGISAGIGGNKPYLATTFDLNRDWLDVKAGYIVAGNQFRRITTPSVFAAEPDRENLLVTIKPVSNLTVIAAHQNLLQPQVDFNAPFLRATVEQFQADYNIAKFHLGAGLFQSHSHTFHNLGEDFSIYRPITRNIEGGVNYFRTLSGPASSNLAGTVREKITQKLSLLQVVSHSQGNTDILFGGSYTANRFAVNVDYQDMYLPFLPNNPFTHSLTVSLKLKLWGNVQVNGDTFRSSDGRLRYSAGASTLLVHNFQRGAGNETFNFPKYVVRGHVRDVSGAPIEGAALRIGDQLVYSNAFGEFILRQRTAGPLRFEVVLPEFLNALTFKVVTAPASVTAEPEDSAHDVLVVLSPVFKPRSSSQLLPPPRANH
ncbi:MAG TPA: carboxypeptidase-like regulatory domain-containing protein [Candidatus Angelobacter sp.]